MKTLYLDFFEFVLNVWFFPTWNFNTELSQFWALCVVLKSHLRQILEFCRFADFNTSRDFMLNSKNRQFTSFGILKYQVRTQVSALSLKSTFNQSSFRKFLKSKNGLISTFLRNKQSEEFEGTYGNFVSRKQQTNDWISKSH